MSTKRDLLDPQHFPMLAQFAAGYLHEDFVVEHGDREGARDAFFRDASTDERQQFVDEADRFLQAAARCGWGEVTAAFGRLGAAWRPPNRAALAALLRPAPHADTPNAGHTKES